MRLSEEEMARQVRRAKRFNMIAFVIVLILTAVTIVCFLYIDKKVTDSFLSVTFLILSTHI